MERQSNGVKIPRSSRGGKIHGYYWILYLDLRLRTLLDQRMQMTIGRAKTERPFRLHHERHRRGERVLTNPLANQSNRSFPRSALSVIGEDKVALEDDSKLEKKGDHYRIPRWTNQGSG